MSILLIIFCSNLFFNFPFMVTNSAVVPVAGAASEASQKIARTFFLTSGGIVTWSISYTYYVSC